jgi:hypothetical protein
MAELEKLATSAIERAQQAVNSLKVDAENDAMTGHRWGEKKLERASQTLLEVDNDLRDALTALQRPPAPGMVEEPSSKGDGRG